MSKNYKVCTDAIYENAEILYLLYFNEFTTHEKISEWLELPIDISNKILEIGKYFNEHKPEVPQKRGYLIY